MLHVDFFSVLIKFKASKKAFLMCHSLKSWDVRFLSPTEFAVEILYHGPIIRYVEQMKLPLSSYRFTESPQESHLT